MDRAMRYPDMDAYRLDVEHTDADHTSTETNDETTPRQQHLAEVIQPAYTADSRYTPTRARRSEPGATDYRYVDAQDWWTTSASVVFLPTDASSSSAASLTSIASTASYTSISSISSAAQPSANGQGAATQTQLVGNEGSWGLRPTTVYSGAEAVTTATLVPEIVTASDGSTVATIFSFVTAASGGEGTLYSVPISTVTSGSLTSTVFSISPSPTSTTVPVSTITSNSLTTTLVSPSPLSITTTGTYVPYSLTTDGTAFPTSSFSAFPDTSPTPTAIGSYGDPDTIPVCAGQGLDSRTIGVLSTLAFSFLIGLILWGAFALLRPRFPQIYSVRTWFPPPSARPPPLPSNLLSFLHPPVPLLPGVRPALRNPQSPDFPSDEQLAQRVLFLALRIVAGWSVLGIAAAIPLYVVNTPCLSQTGRQSFWGGRLSTLTDLSVVRLVELLDADKAGSTTQYPPDLPTTGSTTSSSVSSSALAKRALQYLARRDIPGSTTTNVRLRLIILVLILLLLAVAPALYHLLREHGKLLRLRQAFVRDRCAGLEIGWLAVEKARGLEGMGEARVRSVLERVGVREEEGARRPARHAGAGQEAAVESAEGGTTLEKPEREIDVQGVFTIVETTRLRALVKRRDVVLQQLEEAETRYIFSFRLEEPGAPGRVGRERESHEKAGLRYASAAASPPPAVRRRLSKRSKRTSGQSWASARSHITAPHDTSTPTSPHARLASPAPPSDFVAPSAFYKITPAPLPSPPTPPEEWDWNRQVTGSRFRELMHPSGEPFALGSRIRVGENGQLRVVTPSPREVDTSVGPNDPEGENGQEPWELVPYPDDEEYEGGEDVGESRESSPRSHAAILRGGAPSVIASPPGASVFTRLKNSIRRFGRGGHRRDTSGSERPLTSDQGAGGGTFRGLGAGPATAEETARLSPTADRPFPAKPEGYTQRPSVEDERVDNPPFHLRPGQRPLSMLSQVDLAGIYADIKRARSELKLLNTQIEEAQGEAFRNIAKGENAKGWILLGRGIRWLHGVQMIEGRSKEDIRWDELQVQGSGFGNRVGYWMIVALTAFLLALTIVPVAALALSDAPDFAHNLPFLNDMTPTSLGPSLAITLVPALAATMFVAVALAIVTYFSRFSGSPSVFGSQFIAFKATFLILALIAGIWLIAASAVLFGLEAFNLAWNQAATVADGSIYIAVLALTIVLNLACIAPAILLLNLPRLWRVRWRGKKAITPRQRFRAMYPPFYNYAHATSFCIVGIVFAAAFTPLFPLIGPAIVLLLLLSVVAHRFLIGYVYQRGGQTGGLLEIWMMRRLCDLLALQPILLGLLMFSRTEWAIGGVLIGVGALLILFVEVYAARKEHKMDGPERLSQNSLRALHAFQEAVSGRQREGAEAESLVSARAGAPAPVSEGGTGRHRRGSIASILDMMAMTLSVMPSSRRSQPVPLPTEHIDDLVSTIRAAHTHPAAPESPPNLEGHPTPFEDPAEETAGLLYPPELLAPVPIVWLPDDGDAGVARAEAYDLQRYHGLLTIIDPIPPKPRT